MPKCKHSFKDIWEHFPNGGAMVIGEKCAKCGAILIYPDQMGDPTSLYKCYNCGWKGVLTDTIKSDNQVKSSTEPNKMIYQYYCPDCHTLIAG